MGNRPRFAFSLYPWADAGLQTEFRSVQTGRQLQHLGEVAAQIGKPEKCDMRCCLRRKIGGSALGIIWLCKGMVRAYVARREIRIDSLILGRS